MKTAIVYDRVNKWGGAEGVLLALHEIFPDAPLYTSLYEPCKASWARVFPKVIPSFLQKIAFTRSHHEYLAPFMPLAFESFDFKDFDLVISLTSEAAKGIITRPSTFHLCYMLTPTRYLWSGYDIYFKNRVFRFLAKPFVNYLRVWDKVASSRPDRIIAISTEVKKRIKKYYRKDSEIVFPPLNTERFKVFEKKSGKVKKEDFYLIVSRLVVYKRVDLAISVFNKLKKPLVIIGTGWEEKKLKRMSKKNIRFLGEVDDETLYLYYKKAKALIMPQEEEFGLASLEAQSLGTPVIAFKKGGAEDNVIDGKTGVFFERQTFQSMSNAIERFEKMKFLEENLTTNTKRFSKKVFKEKLSAIINENGKKL